MCKLLQLLAVFTCLLGLVLGVLALNPVDRLLTSFQDNSTKKLSLGEELERGAQLHQIEDAFFRRKEAKWHMAEEILDQRLSLADAIERFRALDREWPPSRVRTPDTLSMSEKEWDGRGVLHYVKFVLQSRHENAAPVLGRLEKELQELLANRPQPPAAPLDREPRKPGS